MFNMMIDPRDSEMWIDAIKAKYFGGPEFTKENWDQLLGHCQVPTAYIPKPTTIYLLTHA